MTPPRVTDILKEAGLIDTTWFTDHAREKGTAVHLACQYDDEGTLDEASLDSEVRPYLESYRLYKQQAHTKGFGWNEQPLIHRINLYRGTPDRVVFGSYPEVWDLKSGTPLPWHPIQLAAYANLTVNPYSCRRFGLYLQSDGTMARAKEYPITELVHDLSVFMSCLTIHNWKLTH